MKPIDMIKPLTLFALLFSLKSFALSPSELRTGDLILISLPCRICEVIEAEEGAPFSHLGLILNESDQITVLDSYDRVDQSSLEQFLSRIKKGSLPVIYRPVGTRGKFISLDTPTLRDRFDREFRGLSYDSEFSWFNSDERGEKLYCSEFVAKFMNPELPRPIQPKPMHFRVFRDEWIQFFKGSPPDGLPGISPADFSRSPFFRRVGTLERR